MIRRLLGCERATANYSNMKGIAMRVFGCFLTVFICLLVGGGCVDNGGESKPAKAEVVAESAPVSGAEAGPEGLLPGIVDSPADSIAVTVNGKAIMESEVERMFRDVLAQRLQGRSLPPEQIEIARVQMRPMVVGSMIGMRLLEGAATKEGVTASEEEVAAKVEEMLASMLASPGATLEQFEAMLTQRYGLSVAGWKEMVSANPRMKQSIIAEKMLAKQFGDGLAVTDADVEAHYEANKATLFTQGASVQARHILLGATRDEPNEVRDAAKKKAQEVLALVKQEGADFAALAKEHSSDRSSKDQGGDLGYFPETGVMVPEFSRVAYAMRVGDISDVVETPFGYHIINVTDRKEAGARPLEEVSEQIRQGLLEQEKGRLFAEYVEALKKDAVIEYPQGKGLQDVRGIPPVSESGPSDDGEERAHTPGETYAETVATTAETA